MTPPLEYDEPWTPIAARLRVVCPVHEDQLIVTYELTTSGAVLTRPVPGCWDEWFVGPQLSEDALNSDLVQSGVLYAEPVGFLKDGDVPHWRYTLRCPRPSCGYNPTKRDDGPEGEHAATRAALEKMRDARVAELTIANFDRPRSEWRHVAPLPDKA